MVSPSGMILKCAYRRCPVFDKLEFVGMRRTIPSPGGQCHHLKRQGTVYHCHCEERSDVAIRFLLGNM